MFCFSCYAIPCVGASSSGLLWQTAMSLDDIHSLLKEIDVRSTKWSKMPQEAQELYKQLQRRTNPTSLQNITDYITDRMAPGSELIGAFPPLIIAIMTPVSFADGKLTIELNLRDNEPAAYITDGLTRYSGLLQVRETTQDADIIKWLDTVKLPVMLMSGDHGKTFSRSDAGQVFSDFSTKSRPLSKPKMQALDQSDLYALAARRIGELDIVTNHGGFNFEGGGRTSFKFLTGFGVMVKSVRAASEGSGSWIDHLDKFPPDRWMRTSENVEEVIRRFNQALSIVLAPLNGAPPQRSLLRTPAFWIAFGNILNDVYTATHLDETSRIHALERLAQFDWGFGNPMLHGWFGESNGVVCDAQGRPEITRMNGGDKAWKNLTSFFRDYISHQRPNNQAAA